MCAADQGRTARKERRVLAILVPIWCLYVLVVDAVMVVGPLLNSPGWFCAIATGAAVFIVLLDAGHGWRRRRRGQTKWQSFKLPGVHPDFVAALLEDRARDRVNNPDRRGGHGDIRDDFDDNAV
jgi:hypothetical protein